MTERPRLGHRTTVATERLFRALSAGRGARIFHPSGLACAGEVVALPSDLGGVRILEPGFRHAAVVRFSRGLGLPRPLPDVLGLALRLPDVYGAGKHQDFLLASCGPQPLGSALPLPAASFFGRTFSSLLPYDLGGATRLVGARAEARSAPAEGIEPLAELRASLALGPLRFVIAHGGLVAPWRPLALVTVERELPQQTSRELRFNPWNTGGGAQPAWWINRLRAPAYAGSQRGRSARTR